MHLSYGCQAVDWPYQWLCPQHEMSMTPVEGCEYLIDFRDPPCTGLSARHCPVHGDCTCPPDPNAPDEQALDGDGCPLHDPASVHADERYVKLES